MTFLSLVGCKKKSLSQCHKNCDNRTMLAQEVVDLFENTKCITDVYCH